MARSNAQTAEDRRLAQSESREANWQRWGPYLPERQWGTVREDYSHDGEVWHHFTHNHARRRAYRWGEDGLLGLTDRECRLCFAPALWNGRDAILKERLFGLSGPEGNHGEDVKELYYYLDATPTGSYLKALYKYPQAAYPYEQLVRENGRRGFHDREYEISDTGVFDNGRYFDLLVEYAKNGPNDILIRLTATNRGPERAPLHLLPTVWFRNTWIWGCRHEGCTLKPRLAVAQPGRVEMDQETLGRFVWHAEPGADGAAPPILVTENETNTKRLYGHDNYTPYVKDAFHRYLIEGDEHAVNPEGVGTKAAAWYVLGLEPGESRTIRLRLHAGDQAPKEVFGASFDRVFADRIEEADAFHDRVLADVTEQEHRKLGRTAYAGLLWTKQFYQYVVEDWLDGDPGMPTPPQNRGDIRNGDWRHLYCRDVLSMPDKWEYPWFAAWDLAFHMLPMARIDPAFAKKQLTRLLREWYMHPNGQLPAYEFDFSDVNPPVHAWACLRVYQITGGTDRAFLASTFQKLLLNFTWWVNRKDPRGKNLFAGGFLGLDNIGVFDRSEGLPDGGHLEQADGTAWMAFYCLTMLAMALELAEEEQAYEDMASKFFEHFVHIVDAMNTLGGTGLWDERDGFYYDQLIVDGNPTRLRVRSLVGMIPMLAVHVLNQGRVDRLPGFRKRMRWFMEHRADLARHISYFECDRPGDTEAQYLLAVPSEDRLRRVLGYLLDEREFLSPFGIRSLSKYHKDHPYTLNLKGQEYRVGYVPGESDSGLFGGNSNWRGPVWWPLNYLLIEALRSYDAFYGNRMTVECPTGSGRWMTLRQAADVVERRLTALFLPDAEGNRPCLGELNRYTDDPHVRHLPLFHEYFHGDNGRGLGASHQTGWTSLITEVIRPKSVYENARAAAEGGTAGETGETADVAG